MLLSAVPTDCTSSAPACSTLSTERGNSFAGWSELIKRLLTTLRLRPFAAAFGEAICSPSSSLIVLIARSIGASSVLLLSSAIAAKSRRSFRYEFLSICNELSARSVASSRFDTVGVSSVFISSSLNSFILKFCENRFRLRLTLPLLDFCPCEVCEEAS